MVSSARLRWGARTKRYVNLVNSNGDVEGRPRVFVTNHTSYILTAGHGSNGIGFSTTFPIGYWVSTPSNSSRCTDNQITTLVVTITLTSFNSPSTSDTLCGLPPRPPHGLWFPASSLQVCPACFGEGAARSCGLIYRSVPSRCTRKRRGWKDPDQRFAYVCDERTGSAGDTDSHGEDHNPEPSQGHPKGGLVTALRRMTHRRVTGAGRADVLVPSLIPVGAFYRRWSGS